VDFGINFFPTVGPKDKAADIYFTECLDLCERAEQLGFSHVKTVEHYFFPYGGYSPDPVTFLSAVAARTQTIRLVTGAVIPAFSHPAKLAGKLAMLDNLSRGRLDVGFGRAFLPDEFEAFGVPLDESKARFAEGVEACRRLWVDEDVVWRGQYSSFGPVTLLPRPFQRPHPPMLIAAAFTEQSCKDAGRAGYGLMLVPSIVPREKVRSMLQVYREARRRAGHPADSARVHLSYDCYVDEDEDIARATAEAGNRHYVEKLTEAVASWKHTNSDAYRGYEKLTEQVKSIRFDESLRDGKIIAGNPDEVLAQLRTVADSFGNDVTVSLQVNTWPTTADQAARTMQLLAEHVIPHVVLEPV
jgi:alkanesulfonate monooxygenase SsuD/methylene tetrahydromethanopterin reductase-like flavin-dependent oxidoreductase (luciferase family)